MLLWPENCLGGRIDGQLVSTATLATFDRIDNHIGPVGWIGMILVDEAHRGRGFGGQMFDAILRLAAERGVQSLALDATDSGRVGPAWCATSS